MESINWDAISGSAEVIGVVAVLASILYLARQVAQGNKLNQADSVRTFLSQYNTWLSKISDPDMVEIWRRGSADFESLTDHEKSRLHLLLHAHFMLGQAQRMINPNGNEPLSEFADFATAAVLAQRGFKQWWNIFSPVLPDQEYVKRLENYPISKGFQFEESMPWFIPNDSNSES
jgi:hypothetical protein